MWWGLHSGTPGERERERDPLHCTLTLNIMLQLIACCFFMCVQDQLFSKMSLYVLCIFYISGIGP